jgi:hypothetical protein
MTERAGYGIRRDYKLLNWEQNEFPILCDGCMGESRYIRMLKKPLGAECKICTRPFSTFHWKPKSEVSRIRKTEICSTCAKINNCCQTCIYDLQYHLPIDIRNKLMGDKKVELLMSEGNRDIFAHLANENIDKLKLPYEEHEAMVRQRLADHQVKKADGKASDDKDYDKAEVEKKKALASSNLITHLIDQSGQDSESKNEMMRQYDQARKIVGSALTLGSLWIGVKYVRPEDEEIMRAKIHSFFSEADFTLHIDDGKAKIKFNKNQVARKFMKVFAENFVIHGKKLTVYWLNSSGVDEEKEADDLFAAADQDLAPPPPPPVDRQPNAPQA